MLSFRNILIGAVLMVGILALVGRSCPPTSSPPLACPVVDGLDGPGPGDEGMVLIEVGSVEARLRNDNSRIEELRAEVDALKAIVGKGAEK
jgi:hypothetical protein